MARNGDNDIDLGAYLGVLVRNWWVIAALAAIGLVAAGLVTVASTKTYDATSSVYLGQITDSNGNPMPGLSSNAKAAVQLLSSDSVLKEASGKTGNGETVSKLRHGLTVETPSQTVKGASTVVNFVVITVRDTNKQRAADAANYLAAALIARIAPATDQKIALFEGQIAAQTAELKGLQNRSSAANAALDAIARSSASRSDKAIAVGPYLAIVQAVVSESESLLADLRKNELMLMVAKNSELPKLLHEAAVPDSPSGPDLKLNLAAGLIAGLLVGIVVASLRGRRDSAAADRGSVG